MSFPIRSDLRLEETDGPLLFAPEGFFADVAASFAAARRLDNTNASHVFHDEIWDERLAEVEAAAGVRFQHPGSVPARMGRWIEGNIFPENEDNRAGRPDDYAHLNRRIEELRASNPDYAAAIRPTEWWDDEMARRAAEFERRASQSDMAGAMVGNIGSIFTDPMFYALLPLGWSNGGRSLGVAVARTMATEAVLGAGFEALTIPLANQWRDELGLDRISREEALIRIGAGAVFGAVGGGISEGLGHGLGRLSRGSLADGVDELASDNALARASADRLREDEAFSRLDPYQDLDGLARSHAELGADADLALAAPDTPEGRAALDRLSAAPVVDGEPLPGIALDDYRAARIASASPGGPADIVETVATLRSEVDRLKPEDGLLDLEVDADLIELDEWVQTGERLTVRDLEARVEAGQAAIERFRGCVT